MEELRAAIAAKYSPEAAYRWRLLLTSTQIDWGRLVDTAVSLGLGPLLYASTIHRAEVPDEHLDRLKQSYYDSAVHNALAMHELGRVIRALTVTEIPTIVLKGAALLNEVYDHIAERPMVDLDLLIPFDHLSDALAIASHLNYVIRQPFPFSDETGLYWNEVLLVNSSIGGVQVELHWQLLDIPGISKHLPSEELFNRSIHAEIEGIETRILAPDDQILHLCAHNLYHHHGLLSRTAVDIAYLIRRYDTDIDWQRLIFHAHNSGTGMAVKSTLINAAHEWFAPVPENITAQLIAWKPGLWERFYYVSQKSELLKVFRTLVTLPGFRTKLRFVRGQLFPDKVYLYWRYSLPPNTPLLVAYLKRFSSGFGRLLGELHNRKTVESPE